MHIYELDWGAHTHIGLDLDETLASTFGGFLRYAHTQGKLLMCETTADFTNHDIFEDPRFALTREDTIDLWHGYGASLTGPEDTPIIPLSRECIEIFGGQGMSYSIITARNGNDPIKKEQTLSWVHHYFSEIPEDAIHFVNHYSADSQPKSTLCKKLQISLMIDDHITNALDLAEHGISCILLEKPWNKNEKIDSPYI